VRYLVDNQFGMIDCQMYTDHLASLWGREIARSEFKDRLTALIAGGGRSAWSSDPLDPAR
jgi:leucyl/phenylalanyl-tRNA--protein transferase